MSTIRLPMVLTLLLTGGACSPTFDWRTTNPDPSVQILFPCRPNSQSREVQLAGSTGSMQLSSCSAGGLTFGLSRVEADSPARVGLLLQTLSETLSTNLSAGAEPMPMGPAAVPGAARHPNAGRYRVAGSGRDGAPLTAQALLFAHGGSVYQATVIGGTLVAEVVDTFFESIRVSG